MRLYGGKVIRNKVRQQFEERKEMRDAVISSVVPASRYAWVQIQGSNTQIKAYYPENWETTPQYLKVGNSVRISHPGGNKSRIEIVGHGFLLPTPVAGASLPETPGPGDAVLTGCTLSPVYPAAMKAIVAPGTYRISEVTYSLVGMMMDRTDLVMDRTDLIMDLVGGVVSFDAASATYFRYDSVVAGTDGLAHVVKGTNFAYDVTAVPDPPVAPSGHVLLGWVLIYPNMTTITAADINRLFLKPVATRFDIVVADSDLAWAELTTTITLTMKDQYGNLIAHAGSGYYVTMSWVRGNGTLSYGGASMDESGSFIFYMLSSSAVVTYTRDGLDPGDSSPFFNVSEATTGFTNGTYITLRNAAGEMMT